MKEFKKIFLLFFCIKLIFLDSLLVLPVKAQTSSFNLVKLESLPVSFSTQAFPGLISASSLPVSFNISNSSALIKASSKPVSFNTSLLPTTIFISSKPVSYLLSKTADLIKISSNPVSYSLNSFTGESIKVSSANISYKIFNGIPLLKSISPNLLPISHNGTSISLSLTGENFAKEAVASIGTIMINTEYKSSKELIANIPANYLEKENSFELFVANPPPDGGLSKGFNVMIVDPVPIAKINAAPNIGVSPQIVTFDGRDTEDLLAKYFGQKLDYLWTFGDTKNGTASGRDGETNTSSDPTATHKYSKPGKYTVSLTTTNAYGKTNTTIKQIEIREKDEAPIVDASYTTNETDEYIEVAFDASMSLDPENDPIIFKWEIDNENTESSEKIFTHRFTKKGTYIPKITVTDSLGVASIKFLNPIIYLGPNSPPNPIANISPSTGYLSLKNDSANPLPSLFVKLQAKDSFDKDGKITKYKWTILDTRNQISEVREGEEIDYEFNKAGTYKVKLAVTDDRNKTIEKEDTITILKPLPIASAAIDKTSGESPLPVQFSSQGSRDFDGSLINVKWNFGDGSTDSIEPNPLHTYDKPGTYLATLTVSTGDGRSKKTNTKTILVNENSGPVGIVSVLEGVGLGISNEAMVKLSAQNSFDPQLNQMLTYSWSWIAHEPDKDKNLIDISEIINKQIKENETANKEEFSYIFQVPGQYTPVLTVKTEDGRTSKVNGETITILPGQNPVAISKITSDNFTGTDLLSVKFDALGSYDPKTDGNIISYLWDFGDGQTSNEISPEHTYNNKGTFNAQLTVQDNRGLKSTALAQTVRVTSSEDQIHTRINEKSLLTFKLQTTEPQVHETTGFSFSTDEEKPTDSTPPQITLAIENPVLKRGESISFKAHITDDIGVESVGYKFVDENNNPLFEVIEPAPGNKNIDSFMAQIDYVKNIFIPTDTKEGKYKLLLFAKDKADNWLGKTDSSQIVSSNITISGQTTDTGRVAIEGEELNEKANADVIEKLDNVLESESNEDKINLIHLAASDKNETAIKRMGEPANRESILRERTYTQITTGRPSSFGVPTTTSITNTVTPLPSIVMASGNGTPYIDLSFAGSVNSNNIKNYSAVNVSITSTAPNQADTSMPVIQTHLNISCAAGTDCSPFIERLSEINQPRVTYVPIDSSGNKLGEESSFLIDPNDLIPNQPDEKYTPVISSLNIKDSQEGSGAVSLVINGTMFNPSSTVIWNNSELKTQYKDNTTLLALIPAHYTSSARKVKIKVKKVAIRNEKIFYSELVDFEVKSNPEKYLLFDTEGNIESKINGNHPALSRTGGNVYISNNTTVFKEAGEITIPFTVSKNSDLNLEVTGGLISPNDEPTVNFYLNNRLAYNLTRTLRERDFSTITKNTRWNITLKNIEEGSNTIKLSLPDIHGETIFVLDNIKFSFSPNTKPQITGIYPPSINPLDKSDFSSRTLEISGKDFGKNPKVLYQGNVIARSGEATTRQSPGGFEKITVTLPVDLKLSQGQNYLTINVQNSETNKYSDNAKVYLRAPLNISQNDVAYTFNPDGPTASLHISITSGTNLSLADKTLIVVCDKNGKTIAQDTIGSTIANPSLFDISFILPYDLESGIYHVFATLIRKNNGGIKDDYSHILTKQLIDDILLNKITGEDILAQRFKDIPISHHKSFSIGTNASVKNSISGIYSTANGNFAQENQEISVNVNLSGNITDKSMTIIKTNYGDGTELIGENTKHSYKLTSGEKSHYFEIKSKIINPDGSTFESRPETIFIYKDLPPVAIAKIDTENYETTGDAPFKSGFLDKSYDPNEDVSANGRIGEPANENTKALDSTIPEKNIWKLFKYKDGISNQLINTEDLSVTGNQILSGGKSFTTGNILNPGTYYANLTVFDMAGNSDSTQSETIQVTLPSQKLLLHASFENIQNKAFDFDNAGNLKIQFHSNVQIRGNKQPSLLYSWDFGDGSCANTSLRGADATWQSPDVDCTSPDPIHLYKRSDINRDKIDFHPELTVTAIWNNGHFETWSSKAGTISIIDKPEFVALDLTPDVSIGSIPLIVNFMISDKSFIKNSTITSYEFNYGDNSEPATGRIGEPATPESALSELKKINFTHTYATKGDFTPTLKIKIKENTNEYPFNSPIISTNGILVSSIEVTDPQDNFFTNNPIQTFKIKKQYSNPSSGENRLTFHVTDESGNDNVTELDPASSEQTISLSEGVNTYWFELIDSTGAVQKSLTRKVTLDTVDSAASNVNATLDITSGNIIIKGNVVEQNLQKVEISIDGSTGQIFSQDEIKLNNDETDEYLFSKVLDNVTDSFYNVKITAYDLSGNTTSDNLILNKNLDNVYLEKELKDLSTQNSCTSPIKTITNFNEHFNYNEKYNSLNNELGINIPCPFITGNPFEIDLYTCFSDDGGPFSLTGKAVNGIEVFLGLNNPKFEISYNDSPFIDITNKITSLGKPQGCFDINDFTHATKSFCSEDTNLNTCLRKCSKLNGAVCKAELFSSDLKFNLTSTDNQLTNLFNPTKTQEQNFNPNIQWDVGKYILKTKVNLNPISLSDYGTVLGTNANTLFDSHTYTHTFNITRNPNVEYPLSTYKTEVTLDNQPKVINDGKILLNKENKVQLQFIATDNLPYNSTARIPDLLLSNLKWGNIDPLPQININSGNIDINNNKKYVFTLSFTVKPTSLKTITLEIPIKFPADHFSPTGIERTAKFDFPVVTNISSTITSPLDGTIVGTKENNKVKVSSEVTISGEEANLIKDCKNSEIFYGVKPSEASITKLIKKISPQNKDEIVASKGISVGENDFKYENLLNFNLKNIKEFKDDFLSGSIFGPLKLFGEYTSSCSATYIEFKGEPKTYILLDDVKITKAKCKHPNNSSSTTCEVTTSNNTFGDDYDVIISPNPNDCKPVISGKNKLTRTYKFSCLPPDITSFEVKLKRNQTFLENIQKKIDLEPILAGIDISSDQNVIFADKKNVEVKNVEEDNKAAFVEKDPDGKTAIVNGKEVSVRQLKDLLFTLGYLNQEDYLTTTYTKEVNNAYWRFICAIDEAKASTLDPALRLQTAENPLKCTLTHFEGYPDIKYIEDVSIWKDFIEGLKIRVGNDISAYVNPMTIGTIAAIIAWNVILPINSWLMLVFGIIGLEADIYTRFNEVKALWNNSASINYNQARGWKIGYTIGTLFTAIPGILPANLGKQVKVAEAAGKLDDYVELQKLIINEQGQISKIIDSVLQTQKQDELNSFVGIVEKLSASGKAIFNNVIQRFTLRNLDKSKIISQFSSLSEDARNALIKTNNRDNLIVPLNDMELNDLIFVFAKNVEKENLNGTLIRVKNNLESGVSTGVPARGARIDLTSKLDEVLKGTRQVSNQDNVTFFTNTNDIKDLQGSNLLKKIGLDTIQDVERFQGENISILEFDTANLDIKLPDSMLAGINPNFVKGGITSDGAYEGVVIGSSLSIASTESLKVVNGSIKPIGILKLTKEEIVVLLKNSLNPPTEANIMSLLTKLKSEGRL